MRARLLSCALIPMLLCAPALAQDPYEGGPANPPPVRTTMDSNGVNLATGKLAFTLGAISTGGNPGEQLGYAMQWEGTALRDPTLGWIQNPGGGNVYHVSIGEASETFSHSGTAFTSQQGTGSTLSFSSSTGIYTYRTSDGTVFLFDRQYSSPYPEQDTVARLTRVTTPRGVVTTYAYDVVDYIPGDDPNVRIYANRVGSISNNLGFELDLDYAAGGIPPNNYGYWFDLYNRLTRVTAINRAGAASTVWPFVDITRGGTTSAPTITATDNLGRAQTVTTNAAGLITRITRPETGDADVVISYSGNRVSSYNDGAGTWAYSYTLNGSGQIIEVEVDPPVVGGDVSVTINPAIDQPTAMTNGVDETVTYLYDTSGRMTRMTMPEGNYVTYGYDDRGNVEVVTRVAKPASGLANIATSASYPASCANPLTCNQPTSTTDARGFVTDYAYSATHGGVTSVTLPAPSTGAARPRADFTYAQLSARYRNENNVLINGSPVWQLTSTEACITGTSCEGTANETETIITRTDGTNATNLLPRVVRRQAGNNSVGASTSYAYDAFANVQIVDGPHGGSDDTVHYRYNEGIQLAGVIGPDPDGATDPVQHRNARRFTYDANGQVTQTDIGTVSGTSDNAWSAFAVSQSHYAAYDTVGRLTNAEVRVGATRYARTSHSYDAGSRPTCSAVRFDLSASLPTVDACTLDDPRDRISQNIYDNAGRVRRVLDGLGSSAYAQRYQLTFTANGRAHTIEDGYNLATYEYDGFDRVVKHRYPDAANGSVSSTTDYDGFTYQAGSDLLVSRRMRDASTIAFGYDNLSRRTLMNPSASGTPDVSYTYDNLGRMLTASQTGHALTFTYDALGRLLSETGPLGTISSTYRNDGARTRLTHPGGASFEMAYQDNGAIRAIHEGTLAGYRLGLFQYDVRNRLIEIEPNSAPGRTDHGFGYDAVSRVASVINDLPASASDLTIGLGYNAASQIVTRTRSDADYVFDDPTPGETDYDSDGLNQYPTVDAPDSGLATLTYDARGNFLRYNAPGDDHERIYVYDALNRMVSARLAGESVAQATLFSYDPLGRLYQVTDQATPANSRRYLWDGGTMIAQYDDTSATVQRRWVYAPGSLGAPMIEYEGASVAQASRHSISTDERGSVVSITNPDGTIEAINTYDPYGWPGGSNEGQFQYAGQLWLPEAGLYYMRNRMYDPALGRFAQTDPIGYAGGMNLYGYVGNDPINAADPLGLSRVYSCDTTGTRVKCQRDGSGNGQEIVVTGGGIAADEAAYDLAQAQDYGRDAQLGADFGRIAGGERAPPETIGEEAIVVTAIPLPEIDLLGHVNVNQTGFYQIAGQLGLRGPGSDGRVDCTGVGDIAASGDDFSAACARHDVCYGTLGSLRGECDLNFAQDMLNICASSSSPASCRFWAGVYYATVRTFGLPFYVPGQLN